MALRFLNSGYFAGKVGIGIETPTSTLHVAGPSTLATQGTVLKIENTADQGSSQDIHIYNQYDRDIGIKFETLGGTNYIWQDSNSDDALILSSGGNNRTNDATLILKQDHDVLIPNGNVGIGIVPSTTLHVGGFARINGGLQMNTANATIYQILDSALRFGTNNTERMRIDSSGNVGIGIETPTSKLHINQSVTNPDLDLPASFAVEIDSNHSGSAATTGDREQGGLYIDVDSSTTGGDIADEHRLYGINNNVNHTGDADLAYAISNRVEQNTTAGTTTNVIGSYSAAISDGGSGAVLTNITGVYGSVDMQDATPVSNSYGGQFLNNTNANRTGATINSYGIRSEIQIGSTSAYTSLYAGHFSIDSNAAYTASNSYLLYLDYAGASLATNTYAIYSGDDVKSYHAGSFGIGTTTPDYKLDVDGTFGVSDLPGNLTSTSVLVADEITGPELITNGDFATDSDWVKSTAQWTISGGKANFAGASTSALYQSITLTSGVVYRVRFNISGSSGSGAYIWIGNSVGNTNYLGGTYKFYADGDFEEIFTMPSNQTTFAFYSQVISSSFSIDNVSVKEVTSASNQIQKRELGTGAFGPTPEGAYLPLTAGSGEILTGDLAMNNNIGIITKDTSGAFRDILKLNSSNVLEIGSSALATDTIFKNTGNVGIGTTSPSAKLNVTDGGTQVTISTTYLAHLQSASNCGLAITAGASSNNYIAFGDSDNYDEGIINYNNSTRSFAFRTADGALDDLVIDSDGNVGIGTNNPGEKLDVDGNVKIKDVLLSNQVNTDIDSAAAEVVAQVAISYTAAFFDFVVKKGTNVRSGTVYACHDGTNVEFTETSTNDLGDTSDVTLSVDKTSTNLRLIATVTSDDWSVKSLIRAI